MRTTFTIEVKVNYRDKSKVPTIATAVKRAAARLNATVQLLGDDQRPEVIVYSDDSFDGREQLEYLHEQIVQQEAKQTPDAAAPVSDEFLDALKGD